MRANRLLPLIAVIAALLAPATPRIAMAADVTIPVAIVAREGAWQPAANGTGCELAWDRPGTPTLRVRASTGDRVRQDLTGGEQMALPDAGPGTSCVFQVAVTIADARRYTFSLEGAELVTIPATELDALAGTLALPIAPGDTGAWALATDTYLDLPLADSGARPPIRAAQDATPTTTDVVVLASATPEGTPFVPMPAGTPVSPGLAGQVVDTEVELFVPQAMTVEADGGCRISATESASVLDVAASTGRFRSELMLHEGGVPMTADESPVGEPGCLFTFALHLPAADIYTFRYHDATLAEIPFTDMTAGKGPFLLAIGAEGVLTPVATPLATPAG